VVNHDPQASLVERLRAEEAALAAKTELSPASERAPISLSPPPTGLRLASSQRQSR
jgi:hypothetical protein